MNPKRKTHRDRLLALLSDGKPHSMSELMLVGGYRYGGRLFELRKAGHAIETIHEGEDRYSYRMILQERQLEMA